MNFAQKFLISSIAKYQKAGGGIEVFRVDCNFEPSCSEFAIQAVTQYGVLRGTAMSALRLSRCSARDQVSKTIDPVPIKPSN